MFEEMDPLMVLAIFALIIFITSLAGAYLPNIRETDSKNTHLLVALSSGIFLGILFFALLPDLMDAAHEALHDGAGHEIFLETGMFIMIGFLAVLFIDVLMKHFHVSSCACEHEHDEPHGHDLTSWSAFAGLAIHAAIDGILLTIAVWAGDDIGLGVLAAIAIHKFVELFSLSSVFKLTDWSRQRVMIFLVVFALITPLSAFVAWPIIDMVSGASLLIPLAVATGTFMYVSMYSLLPEAFHERKDVMKSFVLVVAGIMVMAIITLLLGHGHMH